MLTSIFLLTAISGRAQSQSKSQVKTSLNKVISDFQTAIINKDSVLLNTLFFDKKTPVIGVMSEATEMSVKKNNPQFEGLTVSTSERFIKEICTSARNQSEKFAKIKIRGNPKLATVSFDYAFISDDNILQWGNEKWNLVFAENQWLITNINFLIRFPKVEKVPSYLKNKK
jgi:hypothetical protein